MADLRYGTDRSENAASGRGYGAHDHANSDHLDHPDEPRAMHLAELLPVLRHRLNLDPGFTDAAMLASLRAIAAPSSRQDRWKAAFGSAIGRHLAERGADLNTALNIILAALPAPRL